MKRLSLSPWILCGLLFLSATLATGFDIVSAPLQRVQPVAAPGFLILPTSTHDRMIVLDSFQDPSSDFGSVGVIHMSDIVGHQPTNWISFPLNFSVYAGSLTAIPGNNNAFYLFVLIDAIDSLSYQCQIEPFDCFQFDHFEQMLCGGAFSTFSDSPTTMTTVCQELSESDIPIYKWRCTPKYGVCGQDTTFPLYGANTLFSTVVGTPNNEYAFYSQILDQKWQVTFSPGRAPLNSPVYTVEASSLDNVAPLQLWDDQDGPVLGLDLSTSGVSYGVYYPDNPLNISSWLLRFQASVSLASPDSPSECPTSTQPNQKCNLEYAYFTPVGRVSDSNSSFDGLFTFQTLVRTAMISNCSSAPCSWETTQEDAITYWSILPGSDIFPSAFSQSVAVGRSFISPIIKDSSGLAWVAFYSRQYKETSALVVVSLSALLADQA